MVKQFFRQHPNLLLFARVARRIEIGLYSRYRRRVNRFTPECLALAVTWRCNARCVFCDIWKYPTRPNEELQVEDYREIFKARFWDNVYVIRVTGGEPTLRRDYVDIVKTLYDRFGDRVSLGTNFNCVDISRSMRLLSEVAEFDRDHAVCIDIHGDEETNDRMMGVKGHFRNSLAMVEHALSLGIPRRMIGFSYTITSENAEQLHVLDELCEKYKVQFCARIAVHSPNFFHSNNINFKPVDRRILEKELSQISYNYWMSPTFIRGLVNNNRQQWPCFGPWVHGLITPQGEYHPCFDGTNWGSAFTLPERWLTDRSIQAKRETCVKGACWTPDCYCEGPMFPSLVLDGFAELKEELAHFRQHRQRLKWMKEHFKEA